MNSVIGIIKKVEGLLDEMYVLGKADGMREERLESEERVEAAYDRGVDEGYNAAKREFHVLDF